MGRIQRYIFREFLGPTLLGLGVYTFLFIVKLLFDLAELAIRRQVPLALLGQFLLLALPRLLAITGPMAVLLGIMVGMGRLSSDQEITAMRGAGVSYLQMLVPALFLGLGASFLVAYDTLVIIPRVTFEQHRLNAEVLLSGDVSRGLKPGVFYKEIPDVLLYAERVDRDGRLGGVLLVQKQSDNTIRLTLAREAYIQQEAETGRIRFLLRDGESHSTPPGEGHQYERSRFEEELLVRPPDPSLLSMADRLRGADRRSYREQTTAALLETLRRPVDSPESLSAKRRPRAVLELHRRFALPAASILFALLGFPLGIVTRRGGRSSGFALSILVVLGYWLVATAAENLVTGGALPGWLAAWLPNALSLTLGLVLLAWLARDRHVPAAWTALQARLWERRRRPGKTEAQSRRQRRAATGGGMLPGRLDRYLIHHYLRAFFLVLASFYVIYFLADLRSLLDDITDHPGITYSLVVRYFVSAAPSMVLNGLPLAALFAALLSLGILERNNELTAMKAAGISLYRVSMPVLASALVFCVAYFLISDYVLPATNTRAAELRAKIRNVQPASTLGPRQWVFGQDRRLYNFTLYRQKGSKHSGLSVYQLSPDGLRVEERIEALAAHYEDGEWVMHDGWVRDFRGDGETFRTFKEERFQFPEGPDYFRRGVRPPQQMSFGRLKRYIASLRQAGYDVQALTVALHEKASTAAVPFVLVLLGIPYAFKGGRRGALAGAGLALGLAVVYYIFLATFRQLGAIGLMPPIVAAWSPDVLFAGVGIFKMLSLRT